MNLYEAITTMSQENLALFLHNIEAMAVDLGVQSKETWQDNLIEEFGEDKENEDGNRPMQRL